MNREQLFNRLKEIATSQVKIPVESINEEMIIFQDLGLDSLSIADLILRVEECFGFEFQEEDLGRLKTVGDLLDVIQSRSRG